LEAAAVTEHQRLFLVQARTDYEVFVLLRAAPNLPGCHALHYLQMATEMLGKAHAWRQGPRAGTHRAFVSFLRSLSTNRSAQKHLGYEGQNDNWLHLVRKAAPLAQRVENLAPSLSPDGPNPEYPWPRADPQAAPAEHVFDVWTELRDTAAGRQFLGLTDRLFAAADAYV
jgi:hypothetical protein